MYVYVYVYTVYKYMQKYTILQRYRIFDVVVNLFWNDTKRRYQYMLSLQSSMLYIYTMLVARRIYTYILS